MTVCVLLFTVKRNDVDPLCKSVSNSKFDPRNQHYRFCVAVSRSAYFENEIMYPENIPYDCSIQEVSFRTVEGLRETAGRIYHERMMFCSVEYSSLLGGGSFLYISRAYRSNEVFVYHRNSDGMIYLENLSSNVSVADEINSFDFVEY